jgi:hypothetical protein
MSSIYERAAQHLFQLTSRSVNCSSRDTSTGRDTSGQRNHREVTLSFCEVAGDDVLDLLNGFRPAQLLTGKDNGVHAFPLVEPKVSSAPQLLELVHHGTSIRQTAATVDREKRETRVVSNSTPYHLLLS